MAIRAIVYFPPITKLWEGNVFTGVCQSFCPQGVWVSLVPCSLMEEGCGYLWCQILWGGGYVQRWELGYNRIWSASGLYASYWNAFLCADILPGPGEQMRTTRCNWSTWQKQASVTHQSRK